MHNLMSPYIRTYAHIFYTHTFMHTYTHTHIHTYILFTCERNQVFAPQKKMASRRKPTWRRVSYCQHPVEAADICSSAGEGPP